MTVSCEFLFRMRNALEKSCREDQSTHFMFNNLLFRKSYSLWDNVEKYGGARGATNDVTTWRIALHAGKAALHERTSMHMPTRPGDRTHERARTHAHTHTHTQEDIYCFSKATMTSEGVSQLRYTHIVCIVCWVKRQSMFCARKKDNFKTHLPLIISSSWNTST
jgi:hypothetical protein